MRGVVYQINQALDIMAVLRGAKEGKRERYIADCKDRLLLSIYLEQPTYLTPTDINYLKGKGLVNYGGLAYGLAGEWWDKDEVVVNTWILDLRGKP